MGDSAMWGPPVINEFMSPSKYSYKYHKPELLEIIICTNLGIVWGSHIAGFNFETWWFLTDFVGLNAGKLGFNQQIRWFNGI